MIATARACVGVAIILLLVSPSSGQEEADAQGGAGLACFVGQWNEYNGTYCDVWGDGDYAYLPNWGVDGNSARVHIIDISDPSNPVLATTFFLPPPDGPASPQDVKVVDGLLFIALESHAENGVAIVDVRDPTNPTMLATVSIPGNAAVHNLFYDSGFLYTPEGTTIHITDLRNLDPDNPPLLTITEPKWSLFNVGTSNVHDITVKDGRLYAAAWNSGMWIYDVSRVDTTMPTLIGSVDGTATHSMWPTDDGKFVVTGEERGGGGLHVYRITDNDGSLTLTLTDTLSLPNVSSVHNQVFVGYRLYNSWYGQGLQVFDVNPESGLLEFVASFDTSTGGTGNWGVYPLLGSDRILVSDVNEGLFIINVLDGTGATEDCTGNGIPDVCEPDCNGNTVADSCDIESGTSEDCTGNGVPDECEPDCNENTVPDSCDILVGTSDDCTGNGIPDECEPDCNGNGVADSCDISEGTAVDCNGNGRPDQCDVTDGTADDCNDNGRLDACDVSDGTADDINNNGIPDECESCVPSMAPEPELIPNGFGQLKESAKNRFLSFSVNAATKSQAVRVTFAALPPPFDVWNGFGLWVGPVSQVSENGAIVEPLPSFPNFNAATLQRDPFFFDWGVWDVVHVFHEGILPHGIYLIQVIDESCDVELEASYSASLQLVPARWGDTIEDLSGDPPGPPDGVVNITDTLAVLGRFGSQPGSITKARADLEPGCLDLLISITDALRAISGFQGLDYPFEPSAPDPRDSTCVSPLP